MQKLSRKSGDDWVEHSHPAVFARQSVEGKHVRLVAGVPGGDSSILRRMLACLEQPFYLLYVLHTPRGEGVSGRYQSAALSEQSLIDFLERFSGLLGADARHDVWVHSPGGNATLVWERHNLIYAYGNVACFEAALSQMGFVHGAVDMDFPHAHHYRAEYDADAKDILTYLDWSYSPLHPQDEQ